MRMHPPASFLAAVTAVAMAQVAAAVPSPEARGARSRESAPRRAERPSGAPTGGTLVVLNKAEATASLIDEKTGRVVATLPTGTGPHEAATSPDGRTVLVGNYGRSEPGSSLTVIDLDPPRVRRTIALGGLHRPHGIAWLSDGRRAIVTVEAAQAVAVVDVEKGEVVSTIPTGQRVSHMVALSPDERRAYVANIGSGSMTVIDLEEGHKLRDVATGRGAEGVTVTPDGSQVWVTNRAEDTVSVIDAGTLRVVRTLASASFPIRATATPDGRHVLVSNARSGDLTVFDTRRLEEVRRIEFDSRATDAEGRLFGDAFGDSPVPIGVLVRPDGRKAWVALAGADVVAVIDLDHWKVTGVVRAGEEPDGMAWSHRKVRAAGS